MTEKIRKPRQNFIADQRHEYAKLMVIENYSNQQVMDISGAGYTAVARWKEQYLAEQKGSFIEGKTALNPDKRRIQELEKALSESKLDVALLKKATAFFIRDNPALK